MCLVGGVDFGCIAGGGLWLWFSWVVGVCGVCQ